MRLLFSMLVALVTGAALANIDPAFHDFHAEGYERRFL
jgi:hypothetical protein